MLGKVVTDCDPAEDDAEVYSQQQMNEQNKCVGWMRLGSKHEWTVINI